MAPSAPSESQILYSYLLHPSPLPTILPYKTFLNLLPKSSAHLANSHPTGLSRLYRDLQFQRAITIDDIRRRIDSECLRSNTLTARLKRQIAREEMSARPKKRKYHHEDEDEDEAEDEETLIEEEVALKFDTALHDNIPPLQCDSPPDTAPEPFLTVTTRRTRHCSPRPFIRDHGSRVLNRETRRRMRRHGRRVE